MAVSSKSTNNTYSGVNDYKPLHFRYVLLEYKMGLLLHLFTPFLNEGIDLQNDTIPLHSNVMFPSNPILFSSMSRSLSVAYNL